MATVVPIKGSVFGKYMNAWSGIPTHSKHADTPGSIMRPTRAPLSVTPIELVGTPVIKILTIPDDAGSEMLPIRGPSPFHIHDVYSWNTSFYRILLSEPQKFNAIKYTVFHIFFFGK